MRVFLIGASGVIGRRVVPLLLARGHQVTAAARPGSTRAPSAAQGVTTVAVDIFDEPAARSAMRGHDAVINLATRVPTGTFRPFLPGAWRNTDRIRRDASRALTVAARTAGVSRFIQESFAPIYVDGGEEWIDETAPVKPALYNQTVLDAERSAAAFTDNFAAGVVLRFALFYGEDDHFTRMAIDTIRHGWVPFFGRGDAYLSMIHHADAAAAAVAALEAPSGIYNVVDDEPLTRQEFGNAIAALAGARPPRMLPSLFTTLAGSIGETLARSLRISNRKLRAATGWAPRYPSAREGWQAVMAEAVRISY